MVQVLARRSKNNPILLGDPGVGKTAIAEGLARAIVTGRHLSLSVLPLKPRKGRAPVLFLQNMTQALQRIQGPCHKSLLLRLKTRVMRRGAAGRLSAASLPPGQAGDAAGPGPAHCGRQGARRAGEPRHQPALRDPRCWRRRPHVRTRACILEEMLLLPASELHYQLQKFTTPYANVVCCAGFIVSRSRACISLCSISDCIHDCQYSPWRCVQGRSI